MTVRESSKVKVQPQRTQRTEGLTAPQLIRLLIEELVTSGPESQGRGPTHYTQTEGGVEWGYPESDLEMFVISHRSADLCITTKLLGSASASISV